MKRWVDRDTVVLGDDDFSNIVVGPVQRPSKRQRIDDGRSLLNDRRAGASVDSAIVLSPTPSVKNEEDVDLDLDLDAQQWIRSESLDTPPSTSSETEGVAIRAAGKQGNVIAATGIVATGREECRRLRQLSHVSITGPAYPRSSFHGCEAPLPPVSAVQARAILRDAFFEAVESNELPDYATYKIDQFSIYISTGRRTNELVTLEKLLQHNYPEFSIDGMLSAGGKKCYVQDVRFDTLAIEGYGDMSLRDFTGTLCVQPKYQKSLPPDWYELGTPAPEYVRFHKPFLWLARFCKHYVDYLLNTPHVTLTHFRQRFGKWLVNQYSGDPRFEQWLAEAGFEDFRTTIAANVAFLWKECYSIDDPEAGLCKHPIWGEVDPTNSLILQAIPTQPGDKKLRTIVTPFAFQCFRSMYFGEKLEERTITDRIALQKSDNLKALLKLTPRQATIHPPPVQTITPRNSRSVSQDDTSTAISAGDVVCVSPDANTPWGAKAHTWYAYVQGVHPYKGRTSLDVLWLYEPQDTTLGKAHYPFANELFLSDNCSCGRTALDSSCVLKTVKVAWYARDPYKQQGLCVRQKFRTVHDQDTYDFVALQPSDFSCQCNTDIHIFDECRAKYTIGDTVLVREWNEDLGEDRLQPAQIIEFDYQKRRAVLRHFARKSEHQSQHLNDNISKPRSRPNELVLTDAIFDKACDKIVRKCNIRFIEQAQIDSGDIVTPYDRDGTGDFFCIARGDLSQTDGFPPIVEGWNPLNHSRERLVGMSLFCGGGTFDRGLEEAGAAKFKYAVDLDPHALHSYRANVRRPEKVEYFLGSVNDLLARAMAGDKSVAQPGDMNLITGGSPCPGFSMLQLYKLSEESKQNASLVASVVSFVDFYVPQYFLLENVVSMTTGMGPNKNENVFSQIVAALVGLGYQVQQFLGDAWSHGSSQQRSRVFIIASAPGLPPLSPIAHSHGHPNKEFKSRKLGLSSNGLPFGNRRDDFTAFQHVNPADATADLPDIADAQPQLCTRFPDHRTMSLESAQSRTRMAAVPVRPPGMGLVQAKTAGLLRGEPFEFCNRVNAVRRKENSRMYSRILPHGLFPTIVTKTAVGDGINGRVMHWSQNRIITVMEARRAQGYQDWEVIVGTPAQQMRIVGNSVDRKVALVLGLLLRESWDQAKPLQSQTAYVRDAVVLDKEDTVTETTAGALPPTVKASDSLELEVESTIAKPLDTTADAFGDRPQEVSHALTSRDRPNASFNFDEVDNRTAKMMLFMPEALEEVDEDSRA